MSQPQGCVVWTVISGIMALLGLICTFVVHSKNPNVNIFCNVMAVIGIIGIIVKVISARR